MSDELFKSFKQLQATHPQQIIRIIRSEKNPVNLPPSITTINTSVWFAQGFGVASVGPKEWSYLLLADGSAEPGEEKSPAQKFNELVAMAGTDLLTDAFRLFRVSRFTDPRAIWAAAMFQFNHFESLDDVDCIGNALAASVLTMSRLIDPPGGAPAIGDFTLHVKETMKRLDIDIGKLNRLVKHGNLRDNGKSGTERRLSRSSVESYEQGMSKAVNRALDGEGDSQLRNSGATLRNLRKR